MLRSSLSILVILCFYVISIGQNLSISGNIVDNKNVGIPFATIILKSAKDSSMVKADITTDNGSFIFERLAAGQYFAEASYIGLTTFITGIINIEKSTTLPDIVLQEDAKQLDEVVVTAARALVEVKADRTVFNVQGTINSAGENGLNLLRKAPGVLVDNNNNISVLGRAGVLVYVDGKRIPLTGDDLTNYLENLSSEQIDKIDIITNPGSKYEAQGNAGIIDIRLKKDKNLG
ncbi:MAG TPA: carboxypeptidase-like regulatory domain-containing protein, partial [Saprospiraceae bacterium]|nr:carboxypeptidase-like regulatory domain-containing protein [Saprospiraceae bacterium]